MFKLLPLKSATQRRKQRHTALALPSKVGQDGYKILENREKSQQSHCGPWNNYQV